MVNMRYTTNLISMLGCILFSYIFFVSKDTDIYLHIANPRHMQKIDMVVKIDGKEIFNDTLSAHPPSYIRLSEQLRGGFHKVYISSQTAHIVHETSLLLLFDRYIFIDYQPHDFESHNTSSFLVKSAMAAQPHE